MSNFYPNVVVTQAKGYRVGPVYDDVLSMAWVFLELIVKSMALEQSRTYSETLPPGLFSCITYSLFVKRTVSLVSVIRPPSFSSIEFYRLYDRIKVFAEVHNRC